MGVGYNVTNNLQLTTNTSTFFHFCRDQNNFLIFEWDGKRVRSDVKESLGIFTYVGGQRHR